MDRITSIRVFNLVCVLGSLTAVSRATGLSKPMVSRYLLNMEQWVGERLIHRTSRKLSITTKGEEVFSQTIEIERMTDSLGNNVLKDNMQGKLRVSCAHFTAMHIINPIIPCLLSKYPLIHLDIDINNQHVDMISERIDVALRITNTPDASLIARKLGECNSVLCASPAYLRKKGSPKQPIDLKKHDCLIYSNFTTGMWNFTDNSGEEISVTVKSNVGANVSSVLYEIALADCGIAMVPELEARESLKQGKLVRIMPDFEPRCMGVYALYHSRLLKPKTLHVFLDMVEKNLRIQNDLLTYR